MIAFRILTAPDKRRFFPCAVEAEEFRVLLENVFPIQGLVLIRGDSVRPPLECELIRLVGPHSLNRSNNIRQTPRIGEIRRLVRAAKCRSHAQPPYEVSVALPNRLAL